VLSRVRCGCVGDENGVVPSELSVDDTETDLGDWDTGRSVNRPRVFLKVVEASVNTLR
jgi:hypothetical protein